MKPLSQTFPGSLRRALLFVFGFFFAMIAAYVAGYITGNEGTSRSGLACLALELGRGDPAFWLLMSAAVLISARTVERKGSPSFPLAFMVFGYALVVLIPFTFQGMPAHPDFVLNACLGLLLGICFGLPKRAFWVPSLAVAAAAQPALGIR
jgi:hypothetical protein